MENSTSQWPGLKGKGQDDEIVTALNTHKVRHFVVDDRTGFERIAQRVADPSRIEFTVRIRPARNMSLHDFRSKFGAEPDDAAVLLKEIAKRGFKTGLTFHPGSQCCDPAAFVALIFDAAGVARSASVTPATLNVGGGFPARYSGADIPPLEHFFRDIRDAFIRVFDSSKTRLICEPGRALSAPTMSLLTQVKHRRENGDIFLNDGIYGSLAEPNLIPIRPPVRFWRGAGLLIGATSPARIYGPTCDPIDVLPERLQIPEALATGDWMEFGLLGAYSTATMTNFNGYGCVETAFVDQILTR